MQQPLSCSSHGGAPSMRVNCDTTSRRRDEAGRPTEASFAALTDPQGYISWQLHPDIKPLLPPSPLAVTALILANHPT